MKAYVFIYSRTSEKDYRPLTIIPDSRCPKEFLMKAESRATGLIRASDNELEQPQWLFMKEGNCVIWGVACMNWLLDSRYSNDKTDTPIRGFTAFVIPNYNGESLPYDVSCFSIPFCKVMDELFFAYSSSVSNVEVEIPTEGKCIEPGGWSNTLNTDIRYCKIMPCSVNGTSLLKEALRYSDDISIAINVAKAESVNDKKVCPPMNAVLRDGMSEQIVETGLFPSKRVVAPVPKWDDGDVDVLPPVMYGPPVIVGRKENPIKRLIGDILLVASLIAIVVFVCFIVFKTKGEGSDANHSSSSSTQKEIKKIEKKEIEITIYSYCKMNYPNRIEEFTKEQMVSFVTQYPKALKAETLRRQLIQCMTLKEIMEMIQQSTPPISKQVLNDRKQYLEQHCDELPQGELKKDTEETLKEMEKADDLYWSNNNSSLSGLKNYEQRYPRGRHISEIITRRYQLECQVAERQEQIDNALSTTKSIFKYGGLTICAGLFVLVIYTAITSDIKITWTTLGPLFYITYRLKEW